MKQYHFTTDKDLVFIVIFMRFKKNWEYFSFFQVFKPNQKGHTVSFWGLTGLCLASSLSTSGAIQPSVPGTPDFLLKLCLPTASFLHRPKSEIMALTRPCMFGIDTRILCGFRSLWTINPWETECYKHLYQTDLWKKKKTTVLHEYWLFSLKKQIKSMSFWCYW